MARSHAAQAAFEYDYERRPSFGRRFRRSFRHFYRDAKSTVLLMLLAAGIMLGLLEGGKQYMELIHKGVDAEVARRNLDSEGEQR